MITQRCPTCGQKKKRSVEQNSRYWKLVRLMASVSQDFSAETFHEYFADKFLPKLEVTLPDYTTKLVRISTANLPMHPDLENPDAANWDDYTMQVERWCADRGVYLQDGD